MRNTKTSASRLVAFLLVFCMAFSCVGVSAFAAEGDSVVSAVDPSSAVGKVVIPDGTAAISDNAFEGCIGLTSIEIPASVKTIGAYAFKGCENLETVVFKGNLDDVGIMAFNDTAWYKNYPTDFVYASSPAGFNLLVGYKGNAEELKLPVSTSVIADGAFFGNTTLKSIVIPVRTSAIGDFAFYGCENLESVTVKGSLIDCGYQAFENTSWLKNYAGEFVIFGTTLVKYNGDKDLVLIPNTVTKISSYAFSDCKTVTTVRVPLSVKEIGANAFYLFNDNGNNKYAEIYCWKDSYADTYAKNSGLTVASYLSYPGDIDGNGKVMSSDARIALRYAIKLDRSLDESQVLIADINADGKINSADARFILRIALKLSEYTAEDLLYKPSTDFEILMAYTEAVRLAYIKEAGYSLKEYQSIDDVKIGPSWIKTVLNNPFKTELTKEKKAKAQNISSDTVAALEKLYVCDLTQNGIIKEATCRLSDSDKYYITIVLNDEVDVEGTDSLTSHMFPVVAREDMNNLLETKEKTWYNARNTDFNYKITYTNCTLNAIVDVASGNIEDIEMKMGYKFDVWGQIMLTKINDGSTATRTDTVLYNDFDYTVKGFEPSSSDEATNPPDMTDDGKNPVTVPTTKEDKGADILDTLKNLIGGLIKK